LHAPFYIQKRSLLPRHARDKRQEVLIERGVCVCVSQVVKSYKDEGLWDNTVLVFTTDNGGIGIGNNFPLRGMKVRTSTLLRIA
jgi:hypothetical protein